MKDESIGSESMRYLIRKIGRKVDNFNGIKGTFFDAEITSDAKDLIYDCKGIILLYFDADLSLGINRTDFLAFQVTFFGFTFFIIQNRESFFLVGH